MRTCVRVLEQLLWTGILVFLGDSLGSILCVGRGRPGHPNGGGSQGHAGDLAGQLIVGGLVACWAQDFTFVTSYSAVRAAVGVGGL